MRMSRSKKIALYAVCCALLLWCCRIYSVNRVEGEREYIMQLGETLQAEGMDIVPLEAHLFSQEEYLEYFGLTQDKLVESDTNSRIICVCLSVTNTTERDMSWDVVMDKTTGGFETKTWGSMSSPYEGREINVFMDECLRSSQSQNVWYVTSVNPICFRERTWKRMECKDFCYVLQQASGKTVIELE